MDKENVLSHSPLVTDKTATRPEDVADVMTGEKQAEIAPRRPSGNTESKCHSCHLKWQIAVVLPDP